MKNTQWSSAISRRKCVTGLWNSFVRGIQPAGLWWFLWSAPKIKQTKKKRLSKQSRRWWLETPPRSLWRHCKSLIKSVVDQSCISLPRPDVFKLAYWVNYEKFWRSRPVFLLMGPHKLLNKQSTDRWFKTTWRSCDVIVMGTSLSPLNHVCGLLVYAIMILISVVMLTL